MLTCLLIWVIITKLFQFKILKNNLNFFKYNINVKVTYSDYPACVYWNWTFNIWNMKYNNWYLTIDIPCISNIEQVTLKEIKKIFLKKNDYLKFHILRHRLKTAFCFSCNWSYLSKYLTINNLKFNNDRFNLPVILPLFYKMYRNVSRILYT